jgi:hypothetical protein
VKRVLACLAGLAMVTLVDPASGSTFVAFELAPWGGACPQGHFFALTDDGQVLKGTGFSQGCGGYVLCGRPPTSDKTVDLSMDSDGGLWVLTAGGELWTASVGTWEGPCGTWTMLVDLPASTPFVGLADANGDNPVLYALTVSGEVWARSGGPQEWIPCYFMGQVTSIPDVSPAPSTWGQIKAGR